MDVNSQEIAFPGRERQFRVLVETLAFNQVRTFHQHDWNRIAGRCVKGGRSPACPQRRSRPMLGPHRCLQMIDIVGNGMPKMWQNGRGGYRGSATGEAQWPLCRMPLDSRSTLRGDRCVKRQAAAGSLVPWCMCQNRLATRWGDAIADWTLGMGDRRPAVGRGRTINRHRRGSAHLMSALTRLWTVIFLVSDIETDWSGRICIAGPMQWLNYGYQCPAAETSAPYHLDTPLTIVSRSLCIWYVGHSSGEANKRSIDSKHGARGGNYPAHNRPIFGQSLVSILRSREIPFLGSREKIENQDSRVSLTSIETTYTHTICHYSTQLSKRCCFYCHHNTLWRNIKLTVNNMIILKSQLLDIIVTYIPRHSFETQPSLKPLNHGIIQRNEVIFRRSAHITFRW